MENNFEYDLQDMNEMTVTLTLEDDSELLCGVVAIFPVEDKDYIALDPLEQETATHSSIPAWGNPMVRRAWQATVLGAPKSWT